MIKEAKIVVSFAWTHPANQGARCRALIRLVRFQARSKILRRRTLARLGDRSCAWAYPNRHAASKVVYANPPDHPEMLAWPQVLRPGDLFVDVGANVGTDSIWAGHIGAGAIALEPADDMSALLTEDVALNSYPVQAIHAAAGAKVDVEGFEIDVLRGCERALSEHRIRLVQLEWNATSQAGVRSDRQPVADLLGRHGYSLWGPDRSGTLVPVTDLGFGPDIFARPDE